MGKAQIEQPDLPIRLQRMLRAVGAALAQGGGTGAVLQGCCQALVDHLGAAFARVWTLAPGDTVLQLRASAGMYTRLDGSYATVEVGQLKIGQIASERRPHLTNDVRNDPRVSNHEWATTEGMVAFAGHPLVVDGRLVGVMAVFARRQLPDGVIEELESVANTVAQFVGREQAAAEARRRLAQDLHDTVSQAIYGITLAAQSGQRAAGAKPDLEAVGQAFDAILELSDAAQAEARALIFELRPDGLEREGLVAAITHLAEAFTARTRVPVQLDLGTEPDMPIAQKEAIYRISQEALSNIGRHAAAGTVSIRLAQSGRRGYELEVRDDGRGFDPDAQRPAHMGLTTMRERATAQGWSLEVSSRPGAGSRIRVVM